MFWRSRGKEAELAFAPRGYGLSAAVLGDYKSVKGLYRRCAALLAAPRRRRGEGAEAIAGCVALYDAAEKLLNALLTEVLRPGADLRRKKAVFVLLNKLAKLFFLFDHLRFNRVGPFHDFALQKQGGGLCIAEGDVQRLTAFAAIAMPMAHLFVSSFTSPRLELHVPTALAKRSLLHLDEGRRRVLRSVCAALCPTELRYAAAFFCAAHNRFFPGPAFDGFVAALPEALRQYYAAMLLLG